MGGGSKQSNDFLAAAVGMLSKTGAAAPVQPTDRATVSESAIYSLYVAYIELIMELLMQLLMQLFGANITQAAGNDTLPKAACTCNVILLQIK